MTTDTMRAAVGAMEGLMRYAARNICMHEETKRGGAIWEICCSCGAKWADDRGGKPPYEDPVELIAAEAALSLLRAALEEGGEPKPVATDAVWLIQYDDYDRRPEIVVGEAVARARFARISDNWNAHLFVKVASNTRDERYRDANIKLAASPTAAPKEEGEPVAWQFRFVPPSGNASEWHEPELLPARYKSGESIGDYETTVEVRFLFALTRPIAAVTQGDAK